MNGARGGFAAHVMVEDPHETPPLLRDGVPPVGIEFELSCALGVLTSVVLDSDFPASKCHVEACDKCPAIVEEVLVQVGFGQARPQEHEAQCGFTRRFGSDACQPQCAREDASAHVAHVVDFSPQLVERAERVTRRDEMVCCCDQRIAWPGVPGLAPRACGRFEEESLRMGEETRTPPLETVPRDVANAGFTARAMR